MIRIFQFDPNDRDSQDIAPSTDQLLTDYGNGSSGVRQDIDLSVIAANEQGGCEGVLAGRPVVLVHELVVKPTMRSRSLVDRLIAYGIGMLVGTGWYKQAVFVVDPDNEAMRKYLTELGAIADTAPRILYFLNLK